MLEVVTDILTDNNFLGAIFLSLAFIILGFVLRHKNIITHSTKEALSFIVLRITLPMMAFSAFMTDFNETSFQQNIRVFIVSFVLYVVLLLLGNLLFIKKSKETRRVLSIFIIVGQITFFTIPILNAVYNHSPDVLIPANMMTLGFRLILYIYCYLQISKLKLNKESLRSTLKALVLNPIMICMFIGIIIWLTQNIVPKVNVEGIDYSFLRIDKTVPSIYMFIDACSNLTTPLAMITIGSILGEAHIKESLKDRLAWLCAVLKTVVVPLVALVVILFLQSIQIINFNEYDTAVVVLGFGAPLSAVVSTYCSTFKNEAHLASRVCLLSTFLCIVTYPILFVIVKYVVTLPIFI